jgi:hypothetical protein
VKVKVPTAKPKYRVTAMAGKGKGVLDGSVGRAEKRGTEAWCGLKGAFFPPLLVGVGTVVKDEGRHGGPGNGLNEQSAFY